VRLLFSSLLALFLAIALGMVLTRDPGRVVMNYGDWTVQTTLSLFVVGVLLFAALCYFLVRLVTGLIALPRGWRRWTEHRQRLRAEQFLSQGLLAMVEGNWKVAERAFHKGARHSESPLVNYLLAARAAQHQGATDRRDQYLRLAHQNGNGGNSALAVGLTQAELQLNRRQDEQAYATLKHLDSRNPRHDQVKLLMLEASSRLREWDEALALLHELERKNLVPVEQIRGKQLEVYAGLLRKAAGARDRLVEQWSRIPVRLRREPHLIEVYVGERLRFPDTDDCEQLLRRALARGWDERLVRLYGLVEGRDMARQLKRAEGWLEVHGRDAMLLLALGRLARRNGLWGKARGYLEQSIAARPMPETYRELASLHEQEGEHTAAALCYRRGLSLVTDGTPALPAPASTPVPRPHALPGA
jgi:HemY protein